MHFISLWMLLGVVIAAPFHPADQKIPNQQPHLYVDDSAAVAEGTPSQEVHGIYKRHYPASSAENAKVNAMEKIASTNWALQGVWKRDSPETRYFLVFNRKLDSAKTPQRWIITSFSDATHWIWCDSTGTLISRPIPNVLAEFPPTQSQHAKDSAVQPPRDPHERVFADAGTGVPRPEDARDPPLTGHQSSQNVVDRLSAKLNDPARFAKWANSEIQRLKHQIAVQHKDQSAVETENGQLRATVTALSSVVDKQRVEIREMTQKVNDYLESEAVVHRENRELKEQMDALQKLLLDSSTKRDKLRSKLQTETERLETLQEKSKKEIAGYQQLQDDFIGENQELRRQIDAHQVKLSEFETERDELQSELHREKSRCQTLKEKVEQNSDHSELVTLQIQHHQQTILQVEEERDALAVALEESRDRLTISLSKTEEQVSQMAMEIERLYKQINQLRHERREEDNNGSTSVVIWICVSLVITTLVMFVIFCVHHRRRSGIIQPVIQQEQQQDYPDIVEDDATVEFGTESRQNSVSFLPTYHLTEESQSAIPTKQLCPSGTLMIVPPKQQKHAEFGGDAKIADVVDSKTGESFHDLMQNMDEVQGVLMDDIMDKMVTAGAE